MDDKDLKTLVFIGSSRKDIRKFPNAVRDDVGFDLYEVQRGKMPDTAKSFKSLSGVMELVKRYDTDTFRAVYVANLGGVVYVLHRFKKKSKQGIKTPKEDIDIIKQRYKKALALSKSGK
jgi:phage-related protein